MSGTWPQYTAAMKARREVLDAFMSPHANPREARKQIAAALDRFGEALRDLWCAEALEQLQGDQK